MAEKQKKINAAAAKLNAMLEDFLETGTTTLPVLSGDEFGSSTKQGQPAIQSRAVSMHACAGNDSSSDRCRKNNPNGSERPTGKRAGVASRN